MVMAYLLLILMAAIEIGFLIFDQIKKSSKKTWSLRRLIANLGQAVLFALMLLLPGIDTSFRFTGLIILLVIRLVFAGVSVLINKNKTVISSIPRRNNTAFSNRNESGNFSLFIIFHH